MGLDQYWFTKTGENDEGQPEYEEIAYHRKFNALEGFMADEWATQQDRPAEEFNCQYCKVTPELLDRLEQTIQEDTLNPVRGFFFGSTEKDEWYRKDIENLRTEVIPDVRERLKEGETIVYTSWW